MSTKFFNNQPDNTLLAKFKGIANGMGENFHTFCAVTGYFRSCGWFKLRAELTQTQKIKILVGIDIDNIFRNTRKGELFLGNNDAAKVKYARQFIEDVREAGYKSEIEEGIVQLVQDIVDGKVEMRVHPSKNLHAKFYLCLPENHTEHTDGWVIMGSSNLTDSGLGTTQPPRYELNVAMKEYDDVAFCKSEFEKLWDEGIAITADDIRAAKRQTHLDAAPTPFEVFMRVLIDIYGDQIEDDFSIDLPDGLMNLKYQRDAVIQGYQMLLRYGGFFLADVVGLGKTVIATMIAKRFVEANGRKTRILVVFPPPLEHNWRETFRTFGLSTKAQFISSGSLHKVLECTENYRAKEEFDLVIVDESHNFRTSSTASFDKLQRICKSPRPDGGLVPGHSKKVMLLSATPLNNSPEDLKSQILLFQDSRRSTIPGIRSIEDFFAPFIKEYKELMRKRRSGTPLVNEVDALYSRLQHGLIEKVTIRRTRSNILNAPDYADDIAAQGIVFPVVNPPHEITYTLDETLDPLFWDTFGKLENDITYARYRAIEFIADPNAANKYKNAKHIAQTLAGVYRVHMVKRLESSFYAFRRSLDTFIRVTQDMLDMLAANKVLVIPDMDVTDYIEKGLSLDDILAYAHDRGIDSASFAASDFDPRFKEMLDSDISLLKAMRDAWSKIDYDPKFDEFRNLLKSQLFSKKLNHAGKLVVFSESIDTLEYLKDRLVSDIGRNDIVLVTSSTRGALAKTVRENFDANSPVQSDEYNIVLATEVLSEGINLQRSNVIVNYDTPWNATRLMQRIGRVNRIGSTASSIENFLFHPSKQGNSQIGLFQNSVIKLQGFHSALGEDAQIFSHAELLRTFTLFNSNVKDEIDESLRFQRILRKFRTTNQAAYVKIRQLPMKTRTVRAAAGHAAAPTSLRTVVYLAHGDARFFYDVVDSIPRQIDNIEALQLLEADATEPAVPWTKPTLACNYTDVSAAREDCTSTPAFASAAQPLEPATRTHNRSALAALGFLRTCRRWLQLGLLDENLSPAIDAVEILVKIGAYANLEKEIARLAAEFKDADSPDAAGGADRIAEAILRLRTTYSPEIPKKDGGEMPAFANPDIIISETFI